MAFFEIMEKATQFERDFLPVLKDMDSLLSELQDISLNTLYIQLKAVNRMEEALKWPLELARFWCQPEMVNEELAFWSNHRETLEPFQTSLEDRRNFLRVRINERSRDHIRSLNILDMPDEILTEICWHVRDEHWYDVEHFLYDWDSSKSSDIQNLRLTCWRLCNASSHLLIRLLNVDFTEEGLLHFENVSMHPTISKGILVVIINLSFYDSCLADDFMSFVDWNLNKLDKDYDFWARGVRITENSGETDFFDSPLSIVRQRLTKVEAILNSWSSASWKVPTAGRKFNSKKKYQKLMREGHEEYQRRFTVQQNLLESGSFAKKLGAAMARMPRAKKLGFRNDNFRFQQKASLPFFKDGDEAIEESVSKNMLLPLSWFEASKDIGYGPPPAEMMVKSIVAIHKAGVLLQQIDIELTPALDFSDLAPSAGDLEALAAAVQRLKNLRFRMTTNSELNWPAREPRELKDLEKLLKAFLDTESLASVSLDMRNVRNDRESHLPFSIGSILSSRPRPFFSYLNWYGVPLRPVDLERYLKRLGKEKGYVSMHFVHLLSGTWADVLDILHNASTVALIRYPTGAECDDMTAERKKEIFGDGYEYAHRGKAEPYMKGYKKQNPLRDVLVEDPPETEELPETGEPAGTEEEA